MHVGAPPGPSDQVTVAKYQLFAVRPLKLTLMLTAWVPPAAIVNGLGVGMTVMPAGAETDAVQVLGAAITLVKVRVQLQFGAQEDEAILGVFRVAGLPPMPGLAAV